MTNESNTSQPAVLSRGQAWALALTATLTMTVSFFDRQVLAALAPTVTKAFSLSDAQYGMLIAAFALAFLASAPIAGALVDRFGARRGMPAALFLWSLVAAAHAIAPGFGALLGLRIALGVAESPSFPGATQIIQRALPPRDRPRGVGILFTGTSIGAIAAPILAISLEKRWGFRAAFLGTAAIGLLWLPLWFALSWRSSAREILDGAKTATPERPSPFAALTHPAVLRAAMAVLSIAPAIGLLLHWTSKFLAAEHHLAQEDMRVYLIIPTLLFDIGAVLFGHLGSKRTGLRREGEPDRPLFAIAAILAMALAATPFGRTPFESMTFLGLGAMGCAGAMAILTADMLARVPQNIVSSASGMIVTSQFVAFAVTSPLIGKLVDFSGSFSIPYVAFAACVVPGCLAWMLWLPRTKET